MPRVLYHKSLETEKIVGPKLKARVREYNEGMRDGRSIGSGKTFVDLANLEKDPKTRTRLLLEAAKYIDGNNFMFQNIIFPLQKELRQIIYRDPKPEELNKIKEKSQIIQLVRQETQDFLRRAKDHTKNRALERYEKLVNLDCKEFFIILLEVLFIKYQNPKDLELLENLRKI